VPAVGGSPGGTGAGLPAVPQATVEAPGPLEAAAVPEVGGSPGVVAGPVGALALVPPVATMANPHFSEDVLCDSCGRHEHFKKCRLISKKTGRWQCSGCGCKAVMLRRAFGNWPTSAFAQLTPDCML
jgi:hypothetical protein